MVYRQKKAEIRLEHQPEKSNNSQRDNVAGKALAVRNIVKNKD